MEEYLRLDEVCIINMGQSPDSGSYNENGDGLPFFQGNADFGDLYPVVRIWCNAPTKVVEPDTLLISVRAPIGALNFSAEKSCIGRGLAGITAKDEIDLKYIYYCLKGKTGELNAKGTGSTFKAIAKNVLGETKVRIVSHQEQIRIVQILDGVVSLIEARRKQLSELDTLIKARFVEMFGEPIENPMNWPVKRLKELSVLITNGNTPKGGSENYVEDGIIFLRSQNVWRNLIDLSDVAYIDEKTHSSMRKSSVRHNDILITKTGRINTENSSLGRAALYTGEDNSANINGHVYLVRLGTEVVPKYVVTILTGEAYRKYIRKVCVGGIDKRQINLDQVEDFPIIMPPKEKQEKFAKFAEQIEKSKFMNEKLAII